MDKETYEGKIVCRNCGSIVRMPIPKGTTIRDYLNKNEVGICSNCGCPPREPTKG